jgi:beta-phosphoglucomutase
MLRAVIFDFDGVIVDSETLHFNAFNRLFAQYNIEITVKDYYRDYLGLTDFECIELISSRGKLGLNKTQISELLNRKNKIFNELANKNAAIIDGVMDFLQMLKAQKLPMAICSGALMAEIEPILKKNRLRAFFDVIVSADDIKKGKPDPEGFLLALKKLNEKTKKQISANQCIVIEDSHWGLEAAEAAGMKTIAVTNSYSADELTMAKKTVTNLSHLSIEDLERLCT